MDNSSEKALHVDNLLNKIGEFRTKPNLIVKNMKHLTRRSDSLEKVKGMFETTNITNLNSDCMEIIFEHLELNDLLNVADSSKHFYSAVCQVYKRKYRNTKPLFLRFKTCFWEDPPYDVLQITQPAKMLKILRNFGHLIENLGVQFFTLDAAICAEIENYLARYCSDTLQRLSLTCNMLKIAFKDLQKPLKKVTVLTLVLKSDQDQSHIQFLNENNLPNLKSIYLYDTTYSRIRQHSKQICYENIEHFMIYSTEMTPFSFGNLKHLTCAGIVLSDAFCECISKIEHLETLKIMSFDFPMKWIRVSIPLSRSFDKLMDLQNILSNVVEMEFELTFWISQETILRCLKKSRQLRKLSFHSEKGFISSGKLHKNYEMIPPNLGVEWKFHVIDPYDDPFTFLPSVCYVIDRIID